MPIQPPQTPREWASLIRAYDRARHDEDYVQKDSELRNAVQRLLDIIQLDPYGPFHFNPQNDKERAANDLHRRLQNEELDAWRLRLAPRPTMEAPKCGHCGSVMELSDTMEDGAEYECHGKVEVTVKVK